MFSISSASAAGVTSVGPLGAEWPGTEVAIDVVALLPCGKPSAETTLIWRRLLWNSKRGASKKHAASDRTHEPHVLFRSKSSP